MFGTMISLTIKPPFFPNEIRSITNWSIRRPFAISCKSLSKTIPSRLPVGSSITNLVTLLSEFRSTKSPQTKISLLSDFEAITDEIGFNNLASGRLETIFFNFEKRFEKSAPNPIIPSEEVIFRVGSDKISCSESNSSSSLRPKKTSKSS